MNALDINLGVPVALTTENLPGGTHLGTETIAQYGYYSLVGTCSRPADQRRGLCTF